MLGMTDFKWENLGRIDLLPTGQQTAQPELLFEKMEDAAIEAQVQKLLDTKKANEINNWKAAPSKPNISYEQFAAMDIRVGTILEAELVPKTSKLMKLKIDTGIDQRTVVSGIAEHFRPEEVLGRQVSILVNLEPRNLRGIESQGMILMAENSDGKLEFVQPASNLVNGSSVK
jgi:methionyl-tRNA synthetase